jgi:hypothetical protein
MAGVSISKAVSSNTVKGVRLLIKAYGIKIPCPAKAADEARRAHSLD